MKHQELKDRLVGPVHTVYTGFDENLDLDFEAIKKHIDFLAKNGAKIFYVMPYNSRYSQLREHEIFELNKRCIEFIKAHEDTIAIVSDCIHGPSQLSLEMGISAKQAGVDIFASIVREKFFSIDQIVEHYQLLSDSLDMPLLVHEMPFLSGYNSKNMNWPMELWQALTEVDNIIAVKEDTKDVDYAIQALALEPRFRLIFAGRKAYFNELAQHGMKAYLNSISMIAPDYADRYWDIFQTGDKAALDEFVQKFDDPFWDTLVKKYGWHRVNKATLEAAGHMNRRERLPLKALSDSEFEDVKAWYSAFSSTWSNR